MQAFLDFLNTTGIYAITWQQSVMLLISLFLLYLAIVKKFEPLLLLPIAFGMLLVNLPLAGLMDGPSAQTLADGSVRMMPGGLLYYLYEGVRLGIYPPIIFIGIGAMIDFGPMIANPITVLLGAAAQFGIFSTLIIALLLGFTPNEAAAIGIIGGADGPTAIYLGTKLAPHMLGPIAVAAYSYMALVPIIQPPIMMALTTKKERLVRMKQLRNVSHVEKIIFPIAATIVSSLLVPASAGLVGALMFGNLLRESRVVDRLAKTSQDDLNNIVTIFLGITVGATTTAEKFLKVETLMIIGMGLAAFAAGTAAGVLLGKLLYIVTKGKVNPLIGSAGISALPMAARVSQVVGQKQDKGNFLLMHAMGANVAGQIGSAVAAGVILAIFK
jgi:sodium ion-translocating decarboxylase beta subunit